MALEAAAAGSFGGRDRWRARAILPGAGRARSGGMRTREFLLPVLVMLACLGVFFRGQLLGGFELLLVFAG